MKVDRRSYADHYGPTTGDRIRLADTELIVRVERDLAVYGEEAIFGGGKVIRDAMGQSATVTRAQGAPDLVITSVVIIDSGGIYKADVGIRNGRIAAVGGRVEVARTHSAAEQIEAGGHVVLPGLIDTYAHAGHGLIRGLFHPAAGWPAAELYWHATTPEWWRAEARLSALDFRHRMLLRWLYDQRQAPSDSLAILTPDADASEPEIWEAGCGLPGGGRIASVIEDPELVPQLEAFTPDEGP